MKNINLALISKSDSTGGGASHVAYRLREILSQEAGVTADHWVGLTRPKNPLMSLRPGLYDDIIFRITRLISRRTGYGDFYINVNLTKLYSRAYDVYHLHDIPSILSPYSIVKISKYAPVIWTFHDCYPFTGGCLYPCDCSAYRSESGCNNCPQLSSWPLYTSIDHTGWMQSKKREIINNYISSIICPSEWVANLAISSGVSPELIEIIPNSVNTELFKPLDKLKLRETLGLPGNKYIVLLTATYLLSNRFKGTMLAIQALESIKQPLTILAVGASDKYLDKLLPQHQVIQTGKIDDHQVLAKYYAAADLFVLPSLEENCPLVLLETMSAGTPAVAFDTGGIPEIIQHDKTGWLVARGDVPGLTEGINIGLFDKSRLSKWSNNGRLRAEAEYSDTLYRERHLQLYKKSVSK